MHTRAFIGAGVLAGVTIVIGQMSVDAVPDTTTDTDMFFGDAAPTGESSGDCQWQDPPSEGPDVIPGDLQSTRWWATNTTETAYSFGTTSCNIGDVTLNWAGSPNHNHPVISQNMFRLDTEKSRFMQIGQAWLKHSFCALQQGICGSCNGGGGCQSVLHPCCSDPYTASRNGSQGGLGPKWQVNAHTGDFVLPWGAGEGTSGEYRRRIRVLNSELDAPNSLYFLEGMYVAKDDSAVGNQNNNASYRRVTVGPSGQNYPLSFPGSTQRMKQGIRAWDDFTTTAQIVDVQVDEDGLRDGNNRYEDGLMLVGFDVIDRKDGTYAYEYAVQNMNSHRSARSFEIEVPAGVTVTEMGFHDVDYHSGDGPGNADFDGTDWVSARNAGSVQWEIDPSADGESANALRWGTLYNFWFVADSAPEPGTATIGLYRDDPANPDFNAVTTVVDVPSPAGCFGDIDGSGTVDFNDILMILGAWGNAGGPEDIDGSGFVDFGDIIGVLKHWGPCP